MGRYMLSCSLEKEGSTRRSSSIDRRESGTFDKMRQAFARLPGFLLIGLSGHLCLALPATAQSATVLHAKAVDPEYDYVIIGGGTAGLTVADRLTADGKLSVLVIEYGPLGKEARSKLYQQTTGKWPSLTISSQLAHDRHSARRIHGLDKPLYVRHQLGPADEPDEPPYGRFGRQSSRRQLGCQCHDDHPRYR